MQTKLKVNGSLIAFVFFGKPFIAFSVSSHLICICIPFCVLKF